MGLYYGVSLVSCSIEPKYIITWVLSIFLKYVILGKVFTNLPNDYPSANVDFSPDGSLICCGTSAATQKRGPPSSSSAGNATENTAAETSALESKAGIYFFEVTDSHHLHCHTQSLFLDIWSKLLYYYCYYFVSDYS